MLRIPLVLLALGVSACTVFGGGEPDISATIVDVTVSALDVRVRCIVNGDGDRVEFAGAAIDRATDDFDILENQRSVFGPSDTFFVDLSVAEGGDYLVQAFAVVDGFNVLSERVPVSVAPPTQKVDCTPPDHTIRVDSVACRSVRTEVQIAGTSPNSRRTVTADCGDTSLEFLFPRKPTPQTYRLIDREPDPGSSEKVVRLRGRVNGHSIDLPSGQRIDVARRGGETVITLCALDYLRGATSGRLTARLLFPN